jgi:hypothetical protein
MDEKVSKMSIKQLKKCIVAAGLSHADCSEKSELQARAASALGRSAANAAHAKRVADEKAAADAKRVADEKAAADAKRVADEKAAADAKRVGMRRINYVILGDIFGKTSLVLRWVEGKFHVSRKLEQPCFKTVTCDNEQILQVIWDTSGDAKLINKTKSDLKSAHVSIINLTLFVAEVCVVFLNMSFSLFYDDKFSFLP